jgi:Leucine-rich repeat (LRR) protein
VTGIPQGDCEALIDLYNATGGNAWVNKGNWAVSNTPCVDWPGVLCSGGRVSSLILSPAESPFVGTLAGTLPATLGNLTGLTTIDLASNELTGGIPEALGNLVNLQALDLSGNSLGGLIPGSLGLLTSLSVELDLHSNLLSGPIPVSLANLDSLIILDLGANDLSGSLTVLGEMTGLQFIDLRENAFSGAVPGEIGNLASLSRLDLSFNLPGFTSIGAGFGGALNLTDIDLSNNRLDGPISSEFLGLLQLTELDLSFNSLDGEIPEGITGLTLLEALDLSGNTILDIEVPNFAAMAGFTPTPPDVIAGELTLNPMVPPGCIGTSNPTVAALILAHNPGWVDCNPL